MRTILMKSWKWIAGGIILAVISVVSILERKPIIGFMATVLPSILKFILGAAPYCVALSGVFGTIIGAITVWLFIRKAIRDWKAGLNASTGDK